MKNLLVHGVYLSVIAVLSFLLYDKTKTDNAIFTKSNDALVSNLDLWQRQKFSNIKILETLMATSPKFAFYHDNGKKAYELSETSTTFLESYENNISNLNFDTLFQKMIELEKSYLSLIKEDDREAVSKKFILRKITENDSLKNLFKKSSIEGKISLLNIIQNYICFDNLVVVYYNTDRGCIKSEIKFDDFRVAIAPKKAVLIEGESMDAEIYLAPFPKNQDELISISVNGKTLDVKNGIAKFNELPKVIGEHTINSSATFKNPTTDETQTVKGEFKYKVLPKCSRDCAKNQ